MEVRYRAPFVTWTRAPERPETELAVNGLTSVLPRLFLLPAIKHKFLRSRYTRQCRLGMFFAWRDARGIWWARKRERKKISVTLNQFW